MSGPSTGAPCYQSDPAGTGLLLRCVMIPLTSPSGLPVVARPGQLVLDGILKDMLIDVKKAEA